MAATLIAYYDGSGKSDDLTCQYLTLAGFIATPEAWQVFEKRWGEVLARNECASLHMTDANALKGAFSPANGWTARRVENLLMDFAGHCFSTEAHNAYEFLVSTHCTVNLADYRQAVTVYPLLSNHHPEQFCVTHVVNVAASMLPNDDSQQLGKDGTVELFFDKNEAFMKHPYKAWTQKPSKKDVNWGLISSIEPVDSDAVYGVQAADFLAWIVNRHRTAGDPLLEEIARDIAPNYPMYMDYDKFKNEAEEL